MEKYFFLFTEYWWGMYHKLFTGVLSSIKLVSLSFYTGLILAGSAMSLNL